MQVSYRRQRKAGDEAEVLMVGKDGNWCAAVRRARCAILLGAVVRIDPVASAG